MVSSKSFCIENHLQLTLKHEGGGGGANRYMREVHEQGRTAPKIHPHLTLACEGGGDNMNRVKWPLKSHLCLALVCEGGGDSTNRVESPPKSTLISLLHARKVVIA